MLQTTYSFSLFQTPIIGYLLSSGIEVPLSELADSIFSDHVASSCVGGNKVLVPSYYKVSNLFA